jgi:hypothetical protein
MFYKSNDDGFYYRAIWNKRFAYWPKRCDKSKKWIWLTYGYIGYAVWTGLGEPIEEYRWLDEKIYLMELLKGTIGGSNDIRFI